VHDTHAAAPELIEDPVASRDQLAAHSNCCMDVPHAWIVTHSC
jgi:hypothetical protein